MTTTPARPDARRVIPGALTTTTALVALAACGDEGPSAKANPAREAATRCHVTHPNGRTAPGESPNASFHGKHGLWTVLPLDGVLRITTTTPVPPGETFGTISADGALSTKSPWFGSNSAAAKLTIHGTRIDGPARRLRLTLGEGSASANSPHFWPTRLRFARAGCWRVTAKSGHAHLTFTLSVKRAND